MGNYIGKCEVLFCPLPASNTVYSEVYGRELVVCEQCHEDRTSTGSSLGGTKKEQFGELARELSASGGNNE